MAGILAMTAGGGVTILAAAPAAAHGTLAMSTPADGVTVDGPIREVRLYFTEKVAANAYFTVTDPGGSRVDAGWSHGAPRPLDRPVTECCLVNGLFEPREYTAGFPAVVAVARFPAEGRYAVDYLSVASDGETVRGSMTFVYTGRTTAAPAVWSAPTDQADPALLAAAGAGGPTGQAFAGETSGGGGVNWPAILGWVAAGIASDVAVLGWRRRAWRVAGEAPGDRPTGIRPAEPSTSLGNARTALLAGWVLMALIGGFGLGRVTGSGDGQSAAAQSLTAAAGHQHPPGTGAHTHPGDGSPVQAQVSGTTVSAAGYTIEPALRSQVGGATTDYRFRIVDADRRPVTRFAVVHDKPLHMIVVGRDLSGYQHLHPTMAADGIWNVPLRLASAGGYRVYADSTVAGADGNALPLVLAVDHEVPGQFAPVELPEASRTASAGPFTVTLDATPQIGASAPVLLRVARTGGPEVELERYLGAYGHLVLIREGDLGYVHVHPEPQLADGAVKFWVTVPSAGRYRAFFDFQVDGSVHTAEHTLLV